MTPIPGAARDPSRAAVDARRNTDVPPRESGQGDPINANVPGTYDDPEAVTADQATDARPVRLCGIFPRWTG